MTEAVAKLPPFYGRPRPLQAERDAGLALAESTDYGFAAHSNSVPLIAAEFAQACKFFPILFAAGELPQPVALLGLRSGKNLFVGSDGQWLAGYTPAYVRRYPFIFMENADQSEFTLCIDEACPSLVEKGGRPLFANGQPTELVEGALAFCRDYQAHHAFTQEFMAAVVAADLLIDNRADIAMTDGEKLSLAGFQLIDEQRFNQMPAEEFLRWRERGWLHLVYSHFLSMSNWAALIDLTAQKA